MLMFVDTGMENLNETITKLAIRRAILGSDDLFTIDEIEEA